MHCLETKIINLDDYACPKVQFLIFKDKEYDWRCSNYPFHHAKTLHCAAKKSICIGNMDSAGSVKSTTKKGPGYCYVAPSLPIC